VAYTQSMSQQPLTEAIQHYLREIYMLGQAEPEVSVTALAQAQDVSAASASAMVKKLAALGLVEHAPYGGISLTPAGERVALEVIRHHRLLELYLA
jgi:DtxR family transcriptional regulator, Mn-dependent transcriptional regulator